MQESDIQAIDCIDIGINLGHESFDRSRADDIERARAAGVLAMIVTGSSVDGSEEVARLATTRPGYLYATAGVHPHDAQRFREPDIDRLRALWRQDEVVAAGECGLDFNRDFSPRPVQESVFEIQVASAADAGMPLFLHEREAHQRLVEILLPFRDSLGQVVVHCFTGEKKELFRYLDLDFHIGITGWICDERRGTGLRELVPEIPNDRLMVETDAPYLRPRDIRPRTRRNDPWLLPHIVRVIAACRQQDPEALAATCLETTRRFFGL